MPESTIAKDTIAEIVAKCLSWSAFKDKPESLLDRVRAGLTYLIGLLKFNLVEPAEFKTFYVHIFALIKNPLYHDLVAELIYYTTTPQTLTNWCVLMVVRQLDVAVKKSPLKALLALFKRLRPDFVSVDTISETAEEKAFILLHPSFEKTLEHTRCRLGRPPPKVLPYCDFHPTILTSQVYSKYEEADFQDMKVFLRTYNCADFSPYATRLTGILEHKFNFLLYSVMPEDDQMHFQFFLKKSFSEIGE